MRRFVQVMCLVGCMALLIMGWEVNNSCQTKYGLLQNELRLTETRAARANSTWQGLFDKLQAEHATLQRQHQDLRDRHEQLQAQQAALQDGNVRLTAEQRALTGKLQELEGQRTALQEREKDTMKTHGELEAQFHSLQEQHSGLQAEHQATEVQLQASNRSWQVQYDAAEAQRRDLEKSLQALLYRCPYTVQHGDSWSGLQVAFGVAISTLQAANPDIQSLVPGQQLIVPSVACARDVLRRAEVAAATEGARDAALDWLPEAVGVATQPLDPVVCKDQDCGAGGCSASLATVATALGQRQYVLCLAAGPMSTETPVSVTILLGNATALTWMELADFYVVLRGPATLALPIHSLTPGRYVASGRVPEPGVYNMTVTLLFPDASGIWHTSTDRNHRPPSMSVFPVTFANQQLWNVSLAVSGPSPSSNKGVACAFDAYTDGAWVPTGDAAFPLRWAPFACDLPGLQAARLRLALQGRRVAFVGDSQARAMLMAAVHLLTGFDPAWPFVDIRTQWHSGPPNASFVSPFQNTSLGPGHFTVFGGDGQWSGGAAYEFAADSSAPGTVLEYYAYADLGHRGWEGHFPRRAYDAVVLGLGVHGTQMALHVYQREVARALGVVRDRLPPGRPIVYMNPWARHLAAMPKLWRWAGGGVKMSLVEEVGRFVSVERRVMPLNFHYMTVPVLQYSPDGMHYTSEVAVPMAHLVLCTLADHMAEEPARDADGPTAPRPNATPAARPRPESTAVAHHGAGSGPDRTEDPTDDNTRHGTDSHAQQHEQERTQEHAAAQEHAEGRAQEHADDRAQDHAEGHEEATAHTHSGPHAEEHRDDDHDEAHEEASAHTHADGHAQEHSDDHPQDHDEAHEEANAHTRAQDHTDDHAQDDAEAHDQHDAQEHAHEHALGQAEEHAQPHAQQDEHGLGVAQVV